MKLALSMINLQSLFQDRVKRLQNAADTLETLDFESLNYLA